MKPGDTRSPMELGIAESLRARNSFFLEANQPSTVPQLQKLKSVHIFSIDSPTIVDGFLERYGSQLEAPEVNSSSIWKGKYFATHQFPKLKSLKVFMASTDLISPKSLVSAENLPGLESLTVDFAVSFSKIALGQLVNFLDELPRTIKVLHVSVELEWVKISDIR
ncbi:unnamed protein product [Orchesella dallaii]|uniref:Uncharacterized protein n=1 Tax=Orchesella dallaii TaxID=48710 RepID=A0ABP1SB53_9HEXA